MKIRPVGAELFHARKEETSVPVLLR